jgi:hypothetical protein
MTHPVWNRETLLDALVNVVPLGILLFFAVLYTVISPWNDGNMLMLGLQMALILVPLVLLTYLTYLIAERI